MKNIDGEGWSVQYDAEVATITLQGALRLSGLGEYAPIVTLLNEALHDLSRLVLDLQSLEFLNSSGIATLSKFVIDTRNRKTVDLTIRGSKAIPWQGKSLNNLQRLMPNLVLELL